MKNVLVITDLTRMREDRVCIAGYDDAGRCVRPILHHGIQESTLRDKSHGAMVFPFAQVLFDLRAAVCHAPHVEDSLFRPGSPRFIRRLDSDEARVLLERTLFGSVHDVFGAPLRHDFGHNIMQGQGQRSLGTIRPKSLLDVDYSAGREGRWRYRLRFSDNTDALYWLTVTDLTWRYYCDHRRLVDHRTTAEIRSELLAVLMGADHLYLRLGLTRGWAEHPDRHFVQITGVYPFPDYTGGRTHVDLAPQPMPSVGARSMAPSPSIWPGLAARSTAAVGAPSRQSHHASAAPVDQNLYAPNVFKQPPAPQLRPVDGKPAYDGELYQALRDYTRLKAREAGLPDFFIFCRRVLREIAMARPRTAWEFIAIRGIGPRKCEQFGQDVLAIVAQHAPDAGEAAHPLDSAPSPVISESRLPQDPSAAQGGPYHYRVSESPPGPPHAVALDPELYEKLHAEAQLRGTVIETLANLWLAERLTQAGPRYHVAEAPTPPEEAQANGPPPI